MAKTRNSKTQAKKPVSKSKAVSKLEPNTITFSPKGGLQGTVTFNPPYIGNSVAQVLVIGDFHPEMEQVLLFLTVDNKQQIHLIDDFVVNEGLDCDKEYDRSDYINNALKVFAKTKHYNFDTLYSTAELSSIIKKLTLAEIKTLRNYIANAA